MADEDQSVIKRPTETQIEQAASQAYGLSKTWSKIHLCDSNTFLPKNSIQCILVPHAGIEYSGVSALYAYKAIVEDKGKDQLSSLNVFLVGTNHNIGRKGRFEGIIVADSQNIPNTPEMKFEHSLFVNSEILLKWVGVKSVTCVLLGIDNFDIKRATKICTDYLKHNEKKGGFIVFTSDMTHDIENQNDTGEIEAPFIESIQNGKYSEATNSISDKRITACGKDTIKLLIKVMEERKLHGKVTCYDDSLKRRHMWENKSLGDQRDVSYLSMVFFDKRISNTEFVSMYDKLQLLSFARSTVFAQVRSVSSDHIERSKNVRNEITLPSWSLWHQVKNGAFVGVASQSGETRASIGMYERNISNIVQAVSGASKSCVNDATERWRKPLRIDEFPTLRVYINILDRDEDWVRNNTESSLIQQGARPEDMYAFVVEFGTTKQTLSAIYLPSVWKDESHWSFGDLLTSLTTKAGMKLDTPGKRKNVKIHTFKTCLLEQ